MTRGQRLKVVGATMAFAGVAMAEYCSIRRVEGLMTEVATPIRGLSRDSRLRRSR
ncbi:MAG TPA: hypothetical protein VN025_04415 [Candidatus Dormibacteraeota bacterium]|nr:hypothetical protein [Candidatus Dormibacteraeota bacterium]